MSNPAHILVVDDEPDIRALVQEILEDEGYEVSVAEDGSSARQAHSDISPDLVLLDIWMPDVDGISLLREWNDDGSNKSPVIMMSGHGTVETAVEATRLGAYDFLEKPLTLAKLLLTVEHALEASKAHRQDIVSSEAASVVAEPTGKGEAMESLRQQIERIAEHDSPVLISGESGVGKLVAARYLHARSSRANGPFVQVGVGTIARENATVELFGDELGGEMRRGRLEQAYGGVLYLQDIADMDLETQAKLVSALHSRSFLRVGGSEEIKVNVRLVAATLSDLEELVRQGKFREDLFYFLNVLPIHVPPLREHAEDVPELLGYYIDEYVNNNGLPYRVITVASQNRLRNYSWPGNIRELKNLVQRLLITGSGQQIELNEVEAALGSKDTVIEGALPAAIFDLPLKQAREQFEKMYLEHQLKAAAGNVGELARIAGVERTHMYRKLRSLGIDVKKVGKDEGTGKLG